MIVIIALFIFISCIRHMQLLCYINEGVVYSDTQIQLISNVCEDTDREHPLSLLTHKKGRCSCCFFFFFSFKYTLGRLMDLRRISTRGCSLKNRYPFSSTIECYKSLITKSPYTGHIYLTDNF